MKQTNEDLMKEIDEYVEKYESRKIDKVHEKLVTLNDDMIVLSLLNVFPKNIAIGAARSILKYQPVWDKISAEGKIALFTKDASISIFKFAMENLDGMM